MTLVVILPDDPAKPTVGTHPKAPAALLSEHGPDTVVEMDDMGLAMPGSSILPGVLGTPGAMFAYPITLPFAEREQARRVVETSERQGASIPTATLIRGAALALALACLVALGRIATT